MIVLAFKWLAKWLAPVLSGALFTLSLAPFDLWPAAVVSAGLLAWLLHTDSGHSAALTGWLYGAGFFLAGSSWVYVSINVYGHAPPPLAALLTLIFCLGLATLFSLQAWLYRRYFLDKSLQINGLWLIPTLAFPALWVMFEWLRSWLLTGFPWLYAGYASLDTVMAGWAPVIGVYGLSFLLAAMGGGTVGLAQARPEERRGPIAAVIILCLLGVGGTWLSDIEWTEPTGAPLSVALYQPNIPLEEKWDRRYFRDILWRYQNTSGPLYQNHDLVLWPESALPAFRHSLTDYLARADRDAASAKTTLVTGIPIRTDEGRHNSIIALGTGAGEYHKQKLVPFGEYVPLERWLRGLITFFNLPMSHFIPGPDVQPVLTAGDLRIAPFICYEVVYPDFVTRGAKDSNLLITVSNDSWFGNSIGPLQHLQMARFRALETARPMLRGTNNGVTAIIDWRGNITEQGPQFAEVVVEGSIQPRAGSTPIMAWGSLPLLLVCALLLVGFKQPFVRFQGPAKHRTGAAD